MPTIRPNRLPVETLFTTRHAFDAGLAGFDGPTDPEDGGFEVVFSALGIPSVTIYGQEGEVTVCGFAAIHQLADAMLSAKKAAARMVAS